MATRTLYRAADEDLIVDVASFAAAREDAEAYLDDPGFGGSTLYRAEVTYSEDQVLDVRSGRDDRQCERVLAAAAAQTGSPGQSVDSLLAEPRIVDALTARGYRWVRLTDSYPAGAETWTWLGVGDDPEMVEA
jgi:hypothetical protein